MTEAAQHAASMPALLDYVLPTASLLTVGLLGYIARSVRRFVTQHDWLMSTAKEHGDQIAENTAAIKRMLEQREREDRAPRRR